MREWKNLKRFLNRFLIIGEEKCWIWQGPVNAEGYGFMNFDGVSTLAHRIAWKFKNKEEILKGKEICHRCDVKLCVNPNHLFIGTHAENMKDMADKGRHPNFKGGKNPNSKLTEQQVMEIKILLARGRSRPPIAKEYGVSGGTIDRIANGKNWTHVIRKPPNQATNYDDSEDGDSDMEDEPVVKKKPSKK